MNPERVLSIFRGSCHDFLVTLYVIGDSDTYAKQMAIVSLTIMSTNSPLEEIDFILTQS